MGCTKSNTIAPTQYSTFPKGLLTIELKDALLFRDTSLISKMDPYIILKIGSQTHRSLIQKSEGTSPIFHETFTFPINNDKILTGRHLEIEMWDKNIVTDRNIGYGIIDLDGIILNKLQGYQLKCHLSYDMKQAGWIKTVVGWKDDYRGKLVLKPVSAKLTRKVGLGDVPCAVKLVVGEDVAITRVSMDSKESSPKWNEHLGINLLNSVTKGKLQVVRVKGDSEETIGEIELEFDKYIGKGDVEHDVELKYKDTYAGNIKFTAVLMDDGEYHKFLANQKIEQAKEPEHQEESQAHHHGDKENIKNESYRGSEVRKEEDKQQAQASAIRKLNDSNFMSPEKQKEEEKRGTDQQIRSPEGEKGRGSKVGAEEGGMF